MTIELLESNIEITYEIDSDICEEEHQAGFRYNETFYSLSEFMRWHDEKIDGVMTLSNTSAYGIKLSDCGESVDLYILG